MTTLFFLDFETTGLEKTSRITEIACVCSLSSSNDSKEKWFETLVNPGVNIPIEVQILTGITDSMVKFAAKEKVALESLLSFININSLTTEYFVVSHNANYDKAILESACQRHGLTMPQLKWICTLKMARAFPKWHKKSCTLENCVKRVQGLEVEESTFKFHRAMGDVRACMKIYNFLVNDNNVEPKQQEQEKQEKQEQKQDRQSDKQMDMRKQKKNKNQKEQKEQKEEFHSEFPLDAQDMQTIPCIAAAICGNYYMDPLAMTKTSGLCDSCSDALDYHYKYMQEQQEQGQEQRQKQEEEQEQHEQYEQYEQKQSNSFLSQTQTNCIIDKLVQSNAALTLLALSRDMCRSENISKSSKAKRARNDAFY